MNKTIRMWAEASATRPARKELCSGLFSSRLARPVDGVRLSSDRLREGRDSDG